MAGLERQIIAILNGNWEAPVSYLQYNNNIPQSQKKELINIISRIGGVNGRINLLIQMKSHSNSPIQQVIRFLDLAGCGFVLGQTSKEDGLITMLHYICRNMEWREHQRPIVRDIIKLGGWELLSKRDGKGRTALHDACQHQTSDVVLLECLKYCHDNIDSQLKKDFLLCQDDDLKKTCLHYYLENQTLNIPRNEIHFGTLVEIGGKDLVYVKDGNGNNVLHSTMESRLVGYLDTVKMKSLIEVDGKDILFEPNNYGYNPLHLAFMNVISIGLILEEILDIFIENGGKDIVIAEDDVGRTILDYFCDDNTPRPRRVHRYEGDCLLKLVICLGEDFKLHYNRHHYFGLLKNFYLANRVSSSNFTRLIKAGIEFKLYDMDGCGLKELFHAPNDDNRDESQQKEDYVHLFLPSVRAAYGKDLLHEAIIHNAPTHIIVDIVERYDDCIWVQDIHGRYPFDVAVEVGMPWDRRMIKMAEVIAPKLQGYYPHAIFLAAPVNLNSVYNLLRIQPEIFDKINEAIWEDAKDWLENYNLALLKGCADKDSDDEQDEEDDVTIVNQQITNIFQQGFSKTRLTDDHNMFLDQDINDVLAMPLRRKYAWLNKFKSLRYLWILKNSSHIQ